LVKKQPLKIGIVGMGPAGLMAGSQLAKSGHDVHFFDHKKAAGRKFLVAGNGGFNLTHSENLEDFILKYDQELIQKSVLNFSNHKWITFLNKELKINTYIGSSGKIFPEKGIKPITVLYNWLNYLTHYGATFHYEHQLLNFDHQYLYLNHLGNPLQLKFDVIILALGGGSWKITGSTGEWMSLFEENQIKCEPFQASNSGFEFENWAKFQELEGQTIKNIRVRYQSTEKEGDIVVSNYGLEGTPIYYLNRAYREHPNEVLFIDFKPTKTIDEIVAILTKAKNKTEGLKQLKLSKTTIQLLKLRLTKDEFTSISSLSSCIKNLKLQPFGLRPIDEVISTSGGVSIDEINDSYQLKKFPTIYACGEMINWDAPTGGYLIQGCVSSGVSVAEGVEKNTL